MERKKRKETSGPLSPCVKHLLVSLGLASVIGSFRRQGLGLLFASLKSAVRKTLYDLSCPFFSPQVKEKDEWILREAYCRHESNPNPGYYAATTKGQ